MNNKHICLWGRDFDLFVSYQNYPGEEVTEAQKNAYNGIDAVDFSEALEQVKAYIEENNSRELEGRDLHNIFKYVMPKAILIPHVLETNVFAILCDYRFDMEHGLAIVFENGRFREVGSEDELL